MDRRECSKRVSLAFYVSAEKWWGISFHPVSLSVTQMSKKPDGTRLIHSLNKRRIYNTQIFFQEGNLFLSHPLNCSLLKREVFVQFYFSQCCVMRLLWMIYNQFLWVMFPQWEWSGNEQSHPVLGKALSRFVPLDTCSLFPKRRNLWRAFFKCMRRK